MLILPLKVFTYFTHKIDHNAHIYTAQTKIIRIFVISGSIEKPIIYLR